MFFTAVLASYSQYQAFSQIFSIGHMRVDASVIPLGQQFTCRTVMSDVIVLDYQLLNWQSQTVGCRQQLMFSYENRAQN